MLKNKFPVRNRAGGQSYPGQVVISAGCGESWFGRVGLRWAPTHYERVSADRRLVCADGETAEITRAECRRYGLNDCDPDIDGDARLDGRAVNDGAGLLRQDD